MLTPVRLRVLDAAARLLREDQAPPTVQQVAARAGLTPGTAYYHVAALRKAGLLMEPSTVGGRATRLTAAGWREVGLEPGFRSDTPLGSAVARVRLPALEESVGWSTRDRVLLGCAVLRGESAPTLKEVAVGLGMPLSTVAWWVRALRAEGWLVACPAGVSRMAELTQAGADGLVEVVLDARRDFVRVLH